jgi:hypothetical protein
MGFLKTGFHLSGQSPRHAFRDMLQDFPRSACGESVASARSVTSAAATTTDFAPHRGRYQRRD